jgi:hypothetical protein
MRYEEVVLAGGGSDHKVGLSELIPYIIMQYLETLTSW